MKNTKKIVVLVILFSSVVFAFAQDGKNILPLSNKLLLNPSFAGYNKNTNVQTGLYFMSESKEDLNHVLYLTYDTYSEKLKGGVGYYFYQGLYGNVNTNETGFGFTYSKPLKSNDGKSIIPSFNINYKLATKQWFVQMIEPLTPPGTELLRYNVILPKAGILWDLPNRQIGVSLAYLLNIKLTDEGQPPPQNTPEIILFYSQSIDGNQNGLLSRPYELIPEIVIFYSENSLLTRAGFQISEINRNFGFYIQNDFNRNLHGIVGTYGWNFSQFSVNLSPGAAYNLENSSLAFFGEVSLSLLIPYISFDKINPWASPN